LGFRLSFVRVANRAALRGWLKSLQTPEIAQEDALRRILALEGNAGYLRRHGAHAGLSPDAYRAALPVVDYEALRPWLQPLIDTGAPGPDGGLTAQPVSMFLKTSGTTGAPKLLPVTPAYEAETDLAQRLWIERMLAQDERNALGRHLTVVSPHHEGRTPGGIPYGANTGRIVMRQPDWLRAFSATPYELAFVRDFDLRYYLLLRHAVALGDVGTLSTANPSTVLLLCRRLLEWGPALIDDVAAGALCQHERAQRWAQAELGPMIDHAAARAAIAGRLKPDPARARQLEDALSHGADGLLRRLWPQLTTVNCWLGGHAPFYLARLQPFLQTPEGPLPLRDPGFSASEGFFAVPLRAGTPEGLLHLTGHFLEFLPEGAPADHPTLLAHQLDAGARYQLIITTGGGLWRYDMKDVLEVTGHLERAPLVRFLYKSGGILSITGEKITEGHAVTVATRLCDQHPLENLCASLQLSDPPRYLVAAEPLPGASPDPQALAAAWDREMRAANVEYDEKRGSGRLADPVALVAAPGAFARWRRRRVEAGAPDGQVKLPPLLPSEALLRDALLTPEEDP
jgi:hypothetical protein